MCSRVWLEVSKLEADECPDSAQVAVHKILQFNPVNVAITGTQADAEKLQHINLNFCARLSDKESVNQSIVITPVVVMIEVFSQCTVADQRVNREVNQLVGEEYILQYRSAIHKEQVRSGVFAVSDVLIEGFDGNPAPSSQGNGMIY